MKFYEAKKKKGDDESKTTTDTKSSLGIGDILNKKDEPLAPSKGDDVPATDEPLDLKKASQADTLRATSNITPTDDMRDMLSRMRDIEIDTTDAGYYEPEVTTDIVTKVDTENLPAVANKALRKAGTVIPTWHKVSNLPGNMSRVIRSVGKKLFKQFTNTPTEDIYMIGNLSGMGPNTARELNAVAGYLRDKAKRLGDEGEIDFSDWMPGYEAKTVQYTANGIRWLVVDDGFGVYIYAWPEKDSLLENTK